jgi:hypothetical protein
MSGCKQQKRPINMLTKLENPDFIWPGPANQNRMLCPMKEKTPPPLGTGYGLNIFSLDDWLAD